MPNPEGRLKRAGSECGWQTRIGSLSRNAAPWTARIPMKWTELPMFEYACHEGNYAMPNILGGARLEERSAESGQD